MARKREEGESFSNARRRRLGPPKASDKLLQLLRNLQPGTTRAVRKHQRQSRKERAGSPRRNA